MGKLHMDEIQETEGVWGTRSLLLMEIAQWMKIQRIEGIQSIWIINENLGKLASLLGELLGNICREVAQMDKNP